ncbi:MAG: hypothetical protein IPN77_09835 [Sandaracinaceae bacterium]|nr:hypothetical protein [Sandaracinaceae bacterium]
MLTLQELDVYRCSIAGGGWAGHEYEHEHEPAYDHVNGYDHVDDDDDVP